MAGLVTNLDAAVSLTSFTSFRRDSGGTIFAVALVDGGGGGVSRDVRSRAVWEFDNLLDGRVSSTAPL